jgi:hypothetical protein
LPPCLHSIPVGYFARSRPVRSDPISLVRKPERGNEERA